MEVFTVLKIHAVLFWLVTPFSLVVYGRFGKTVLPYSLLFSIWAFRLECTLNMRHSDRRYESGSFHSVEDPCCSLLTRDTF